ncbi:hypothetical protein B1C81_22990 [Streptomyces sp. HG99]|nr:hypothetical protein B1C81_22990 [Streptomyces sp. HG99]
MKHVSLGGLDVSRIGLGAMSMSAYYTGAGWPHRPPCRRGRRRTWSHPGSAHSPTARQPGLRRQLCPSGSRRCSANGGVAVPICRTRFPMT